VTLRDELVALAEEKDFSGVVSVARDGRRIVEVARGFADRANRRPNTLSTRFGIASVTKGLTALTVASLIETGHLSADTTLRSLLPDAVPLVDPAVTIEHLLGHTSGIGDYLDEGLGPDDYVMPVPVHLLDTPLAYQPILEGHPQRSTPGATFAYNNGGFVLLSIAAEVAGGRSFYDLVQERVLDPAGMIDSGFFRMDRLPADTAIGYLADGRTNVLHLPVRGAGDGGAYSTVRDLESLWTTLFAGRIVPPALVDRLVAPRSDDPGGRRRYGLGFWLGADRDTVVLEGLDPGVSCRTAYDRVTGLHYVVLANDAAGAWPLARHLDSRLPALVD